MAVDHFKTHVHLDGRFDWNFNILFGDQPQVARMAEKYAKLINHPGLYPPLPNQWLHMTILRAGYITEFTKEEMAAVAELLKPKLAAMKMPELILGPWWLWRGNVGLHITPDDDLTEVFNTVRLSMAKVVGKARMPKQEWFIPHVTLAYTRDNNEEKEVHKKLSARWIEPVAFRANNLSMIKQEQTPPFYRWDIIEDLPIGQI